MPSSFSIQNAFNAIAPRYDLTNTIHSFGLHKLWNRRLIQTQKGTLHVLDLCTGTGAIAFGFLDRNIQSKVTGIDFSENMLKIAKQRSIPYGSRACFICGDVLSLPFPNASFDGATIAYGIRNLPHRVPFLQEVYRVLRPGAPFALLDLTRPSGKWGAIHALYTRYCLPKSGGYLTQCPEAYHYLATSIQSFIPQDLLLEELIHTGFQEATYQKIHLGIATLWICRKPFGIST